MVDSASQTPDKNRLPTWAIVVAFTALVGVCCAWPVSCFWQAQMLARRTSSISNLKQIGTAHAMYTEQHDGYGPPPDRWADALLAENDRLGFLHEYSKSYQSDSHKAMFAYAYFRPLDGIAVSEVKNPAEVPLAFDSSDLRWNANGDLTLLPDPPRWLGTNLILFLDTSARAVRETPVVAIKIP
ncbi:MAG: hypothetical protein WD716_09515 [Fimbriimonadaceae bacterium]